MSRTHAERVALGEQAAALRRQGMTQAQIAERLGVSRSYAGTLSTDPDGAKDKLRREQYYVTCPNCGGRMGSESLWGADKAPKRCAKCQQQNQHDDRYWNAERIVAALREFRDRVGRQPSAVDLTLRSGAPSMERHMSSARVAEVYALPSDLELPVTNTVLREFGTWSAALKAAGMTPNKSGGAGQRAHIKGGTVRQYVVFSKNGTGWIPRETVDARDEPDAIQRVADGEGTYVAVPIQHWQERTVAPRTVFAVVDD